MPIHWEGGREGGRGGGREGVTKKSTLLGSSAVRATSVPAAANMPFYAEIAVISTG